MPTQSEYRNQFKFLIIGNPKALGEGIATNQTKRVYIDATINCIQDFWYTEIA